jgi:GNAT superfamily N-acetyltransferase
VIFVALNEAADKGKLLLVDGGMLRFHVRRDGVVKIHEVIVLPSHRRKGVGRRLVQEVRARYPALIIRALCPTEYESNGFWKRLGFVHTATTERANVWELAS